jgi:chromosome segregation protein
MRLEKIKLAGFKSFVEPTTVLLPSHLVGVVGPNGCGKSNVIDAVRWVMGESSAKMLRGESMADVIFNGSSTRKPVGTAAIELIFDNSEGRAGGQYAAFNQIAVRRSVSRDGQSIYSLNGTRCRRRDITDLFLGTGLGPRSYSIIEQGMISRLIEARPEDLRLFLEEAAGISRYKERRRETENRIRHTRENLDRLNDLREEVSKQLRHLERQAATAEKYKTLKQQERRTRAELLALRWQVMSEEARRAEGAIARQETELEALLAEQRRLEADLEKCREEQVEGNDRFNAEQSHFYGVGAEISRLEQQIRFVRENRQRQERELAQTDVDLRHLSEHRARDEDSLQTRSASLQQEQPRLEGLQRQEAELGEAQHGSEHRLQAWQTEWDEFNRKAAEPAQTAQVERTRINQLEQQQEQLQRRRQRLTDERGQLQGGEDASRLAGIDEDLTAALAHAEQCEATLALQVQRIERGRVQVAEIEQTTRQHQHRRSELAGRIASLNTLQQAALGKDDAGTQANVLAQLGLGDARRLGEVLDVAPDWREAVEAVLSRRLQALCVEALDEPAKALHQVESARLVLMECARTAGQDHPADSLMQHIRAPAGIDGLLAGVRCADSLSSALTQRHSLGAGECLVTREGQIIGPNWMRCGQDEQNSGLLAREQALRHLLEDQSLLAEQIESTTELLEQARADLRVQEQAQEQQRRQQTEAGRQLAELRSARAGLVSRIEHIDSRRQAIANELDEIDQHLEEALEDIQASRDRLHDALASMESFAAVRDALVADREKLREAVSAVRQRRNGLRDQMHELALQVQSLRASTQALTASLAQSEDQLARLNQRREDLLQSLEEGTLPLAEEQDALNRQLALRLEVEKSLAVAREYLQTLDHRLRQLEQQRHQAEQQVQRAREALEQARLHLQELKVRWLTLEEQLAETGFRADELLAAMDQRLELAQLQGQLDDLGTRIERLGRVNRAAMDEFREQSERMQYLDDQYADISRSLEVLEEAIRKIDRETRTRFKETFDKVNSGLQQLFPKLFGGGHAYLQMTGEDLLDTGVSVMARPPGKRNSSIQLLSGGEKALTAVAMVFAIFQLNPAPFCLLDEVDAPLDDANVSRFCNMVREMSDKVQFIFITHNKVTMEMSNQLIGVTMNEPGVSRIVSVDIAEAARLAAA